MNNIYFEIPFEENILPILKTHLLKVNEWKTVNNLILSKVPIFLFKESKLLKLIIKFNGNPIIFKLDPMTWYDWHTDESRKCAINMFIEGEHSYCFFGERKNRDIVKISELKYEKNKYYLFNTQKKHAILNLNNERYVLSIGFDHYTFDDIMSYIKENF